MSWRMSLPHSGASTLQMAREQGGRVRVMHAIDELAFASGYEYPGELLRIAREQGQKTMDKAPAMAKSAGVESDAHLLSTPGDGLGT